MNKYSKLIFTAILSAMASSAYAVPAKPGLITVTQADGTTLQVRLMGDERFHFILPRTATCFRTTTTRITMPMWTIPAR